MSVLGGRGGGAGGLQGRHEQHSHWFLSKNSAKKLFFFTKKLTKEWKTRYNYQQNHREGKILKREEWKGDGFGDKHKEDAIGDKPPFQIWRADIRAGLCFGVVSPGSQIRNKEAHCVAGCLFTTGTLQHSAAY